MLRSEYVTSSSWDRTRNIYGSHNSQSTTSAFTLIELLVVIAIIAILAAILFPVFAQAREKARQADCLSNEKQIGLAILQYAQDFDETYPACYLAYSSDNGVTTFSGADAIIQPYIKNGAKGLDHNGDVQGGVFVCPSFPDTNQTAQYHFSLGIFTPDWQLPPVGTGTPTTLAMIDQPAGKVMVFEGGMQANAPSVNQYNSNSLEFFTDEWAGWGSLGNGANSNGSDVRTGDAKDCDQPGATMGYWDSCNLFPRYRHNKTANFLWADGHVKAVQRGGLNWLRDIYVGRMDEGTAPGTGYPY